MPKVSNSNGTIARNSKKPITIATTMPTQFYNREDKLMWLDWALKDTACDLFVTSQEYFGGHYIMKDDLHMTRQWMVDNVGALAKKHKKCLAVGACVKRDEDRGAMEDFMYFDSQGTLLGYHSKFALPSYDDCRTGGHGQLWPETNFNRRVTPIAIPELRLRVGTIFCWEVSSQTLWPAYSLSGVNLITHPIKFCPKGWLQNKVMSDGKKHIVGFGHAPKSNIWADRLIFASRHQVMCPIAISCNSWDLGKDMLALVGHVDELKKNTDLHEVPSLGGRHYIHTFQMLPEFYEGLDHMHSAGAFANHVGSADDFSRLGEWIMSAKIRRLESHLIGGTAAMECVLKSSANRRQKNSTIKRAFGKK